MFHKLPRALAGLLFRMEILFSRAYDNYAAPSQTPLQTKSCGIITRIYEISGLTGRQRHSAGSSRRRDRRRWDFRDAAGVGRRIAQHHLGKASTTATMKSWMTRKGIAPQ